MEAMNDSKPKEEKKEEKKTEDKKAEENKKLFSNEYYEAFKNIFNYFVYNSSKRLANPLRAEDLILEIEMSNSGIKGIKLKNVGPKENYKGNTNANCNALIDDFKKIKDIFSSFDINFDTKDIKLLPSVATFNVFSAEGLFTLDGEGNKKAYEMPKLDKNFLIISTYLTKVSDKTIEYLKDLKMDKYLSRYEKIFILFNMPRKLETNLGEAKKKADEIIKKIDKIKLENEKYSVVFWIYEKGEDKYLTDDPVRRVKGNFTKLCIINKKMQILETFDVESKIDENLSKSKCSSFSGDLNFNNFFKLMKRLRKATYFFKFRFNLTTQLKSLPSSPEDLQIDNLNIKSLNVRLRTKDFEFLKNDVLKGDTGDFELEEYKTFDIELPEEIVCDNCKKTIQSEEGVYFCYWCKIFFCEKCVEDKIFKEENTKRKYLHPQHNIIYFTTRNKEKLKSLDKRKIGENKYNDRPANELQFTHSAICNGCRGHFQNSPRYLCVSCHPGTMGHNGFCDFCFTCVEHIRKRDDEGVRIMEIDQEGDMEETNDLGAPEKTEKKHNQDHVYLCIICKCSDFDYYTF